MQFTVFAAALLATAGISTAARFQTRQTTIDPSGDYIWRISNFYSRRLNGTDVNSVGFNIKATNNGTLDANCTASGIVAPDNFYECGLGLWFAYQDDRTGLLLRQDVSDEVQLIGSTTIHSYCHAGGAGPNDYACTGVADSFITLLQYPCSL